MVEAGRLRSAWQGKIYLVRNLRGELVKGQGGDKADDTARDLYGHRDQIGVPQRRQIGEAVKASAEAREGPGIAHPVERFRMNTEVQRVSRSKHTAVLPEDAPRAGEAVSGWSP